MQITTKVDVDAEWVEVVAGLSLPSRSRVEARNYAGYDVTVVIDAEAPTRRRPGRVSCEAVTVKRRPSGPEVTLEGMRSIGVADLMRQGLARVANDGRGPSYHPPARIAENGPTDEALAALAAVYRTAVALREPPTKAVREALGLSVSSAGRWIMLARLKGFLEPTEQGKAGG